ncbi:hypothetical protein ACF09J_25580 [Streptomyces sp. NPDC014889]|uniref:hypothetical protein n=1 Tax=Streptomyces sp. NPDC014889 TaxID=3364928 RepID=UPI0036FFF5FD
MPGGGRVEPLVDARQDEVGQAGGPVRRRCCCGRCAGWWRRDPAPPAVAQAVGRLVDRGVPVLVCSRAFSGPVTPLYTAGGGADLDRAGAVFAGDLSPWQARLLLSVALAHKPEDPGSVVSQWLGQPSPDGA